MWIYQREFPGEGTTVGLLKTPIFSDLAGYSFGNFGDEASIIM